MSVVEGFGDRAGAERGEPAARAGQARCRGRARSGRRRPARSRIATTSSREAPSKACRVASRTLRKPWCSKPVSGVAVPHRVVQPGRALERRLAVERRVDPGGELGGGREGVGLGAAGAELQPELGRRRPRRRRPASRRSARPAAARRRPGRLVEPHLAAQRRRPRPPPGGRCRRGRRGRAARSRRRASSRPRRCAPARPAGSTLTGAAGRPRRDSRAGRTPRSQRQVGVADARTSRRGRRTTPRAARGAPRPPRAAGRRRAGRWRRRRRGAARWDRGQMAGTSSRALL